MYHSFAQRIQLVFESLPTQHCFTRQGPPSKIKAFPRSLTANSAFRRFSACSSHHGCCQLTTRPSYVGDSETTVTTSFRARNCNCRRRGQQLHVQRCHRLSLAYHSSYSKSVRHFPWTFPPGTYSPRKMSGSLLTLTKFLNNAKCRTVPR